MVKRGVWVGILLAVVLMGAVSSYAYFSSPKGNASCTNASSSQPTGSTCSSTTSSSTFISSACSTCRANVTVVRSTFLPDGGGTGTSLAASCALAPAQSYVMLTNIGNAPTSVTGVTLEFGGDTANAAPSGCDIGASGSAGATLYLNFNTAGSNLAFGGGGEPVVIFITLASGEQIKGASNFVNMTS